MASAPAKIPPQPQPGTGTGVMEAPRPGEPARNAWHAAEPAPRRQHPDRQPDATIIETGQTAIRGPAHPVRSHGRNKTAAAAADQSPQPHQERDQAAIPTTRCQHPAPKTRQFRAARLKHAADTKRIARALRFR